jgi:hypothetical protein
MYLPSNIDPCCDYKPINLSSITRKFLEWNKVDEDISVCEEMDSHEM